LTAGIESLLHRENSDLTVLSTTSTDEVTLAVEVESFQPNVVIVDEELQFADELALFELMSAFPSLRIIVVDGHDNLLHIYEKQAITVGHSADLIAAILT
jgi:dihydroorotase